MPQNKLLKLRKHMGLTIEDCAKLLGFSSLQTLVDIELGKSKNQHHYCKMLAKIDAQMESAILTEVDYYHQENTAFTVMFKFLTDEEFALYEPYLYDILKSNHIHGVLVQKTKQAIERIGGRVYITYMDSEFYEQWLGVNDFDDSREIRMAWGLQQIRATKNRK